MTDIGRRRLGTDGPWVSAVGLGFMSFRTGSGPEEERQARAVVDAALDAGVTFVDTADVYGPEHSEILLGRVVRGRRDRVVIATKFGNPLDRAMNPDHRIDGRPEYVRRAIEASLRRLGVDHVDLYYLHRVDPTVPIEDTVGALKELVQAGTVGHIGLSEAGPQTIRRAHAVHPLAAVQSEWSLFSRDIEATIVPVTRELGIALVPYSPLGRAWLTGTVRSRADLDTHREAHPRFAEANFATNRALADEVATVAGELGVRPSQVALAWVLARGEDVVPIPGTRHPEFVRENVGGVAVVLSPEQLGRLDGLADRVAGERAYRPETIGTEAPPSEVAAIRKGR
ncbi:aldo/keto reductase [Pseudonocardia endophytica]|uniref:Aryl-alcohol dehydrogenase-like predicted oxidoreductase n=1 Tax=Pseudonocardia endophytica TaxID=401976 RepID=A0A4V2PIX3_PSEEN|nr:aldo/keto reductase [Pseudonocardia endophytica]TCK26316.1 aryl-alcohol dehydrogenase-like predicted oxidoreductase [Pseudonocardia endophytica]